MMTPDDLAALYAAPAFALLHRPGSAPDRVEVLTGSARTFPTLLDLPDPGPAGMLAIVPFRQIADRGLACVDDGEPLVVIAPRTRTAIPLADALRTLPDRPAALDAGGFDQDDEEYATAARAILDDSIGRGEGSNFVLRRTFRAAFRGWSRPDALAAYRRLLGAEHGAYWTFCVCWNGRTLLGASPECHVRVTGGVATMNPISGTYRYPAGVPRADGLRRFLADRKEADELLMVVDEELKMMARVCDGGGRVRGPRLRAMSRVAHTEYLIDGPTRLPAGEILRLTTPAPTVTGSPVVNACRVIAAHERTGRGYYGGVLALIDGPGELDSALLIRTAEIDRCGSLRIASGATLVRGSDPRSEAEETSAKASALLAALSGSSAARRTPAPRLDQPWVRSLLRRRNVGLSLFWRGREAPAPAPELIGRRLLVIDAEDDFTGMLARLAESLGVAVRIRAWDEDPAGDADAVLVGPGPGDPRDLTDRRIAALHATVRELLAARTPLLAICLGHQIVADELGLKVARMGEPAQGVSRTIAWGGRPERVGFYHSYVALSDSDELRSPLLDSPVRVLRDPRTGAVHALAATRVRAVQFHVESLLTHHGSAILREMLISILAGSHDPWIVDGISVAMPGDTFRDRYSSGQ